jgi:dTDP-glucose 4,6-dehydratase
MELLVTGAAGFIGSNFVTHIVTNTSHTVTSLDALTYAGSLENLAEVDEHPNHRFIEGNICNPDLVTDLVDSADVVVNFAAESHVDRSIDGSQSFVRTNVLGTQTLLEAAKEVGVDQFLQISTDEVYGEIVDGEFDEDDSLSPRNPYAATKAGADLLAQSNYVTHDVPVIITRSSNNYGPRQHSEKLIPKVIQRAKAGEQIPVYGDGTNVREWTYVDDNVDAIETVLEEGEDGEIYNVGSGTELQNIELVKSILDSLDASEDLIDFVDDRPGHDQRYALDSTKVETLGWTPETPFEQGLEKTIEYYS